MKLTKKQVGAGPGLVGVGLTAAGGALLVGGYVFYLMFREGTYLHSVWTPELAFLLAEAPPRGIIGWLPSFVFVLSFSLISVGLFGRDRCAFTWPLVWTGVALTGELLQAVGLLGGVFDPADLLAALAAGVISPAAALIRSARPGAALYSRLAKGLVFGVGVACLVATSPVGHHESHRPVYLSYEELRSSVTAEGPLPIVSVGKIYKTDRYILLSSPNEGIHVIDNADPRHPVNDGFIVIPGNLDMAVKDDILYADSFIDLVAIDISDMRSPREVHRVEDVFPYDAYQAVGEDIWFDFVDEEKGVVSGYVL